MVFPLPHNLPPHPTPLVPTPMGISVTGGRESETGLAHISE